jgi:hypothetical protein
MLRLGFSRGDFCMPVICEGCGNRVPIPEGYSRNKIQCSCGVICPVPEAARQQAGASAPQQHCSEDEAERWLVDDTPPASPPSEPPVFREAEPVAESEPEPERKPAVFERRFPCRRCRRLIRRRGECPDCDGVPPKTSETGEPVWWPTVDEPKVKDEKEEDSSPYGVEGADDVKCPQCCFMLPPGSVLCVRCGFHLKKRKKVTKTYQPMERVWETNAPLKSRLPLFVVCSVAFFISGLIGVLNGGVETGVFVFFYLLVSTMAAFLLGTFDRIHLIRDTRGRVELTKTWRVCFIPRPPQRINVRGYEGIVSGRHRDVTSWDYLILMMLLISGIIPGLIWWYLAMYKVSFHVSLSRDHGFPSYILYSGLSETQMREIAHTVRDAAGLPYEEG